MVDKDVLFAKISSVNKHLDRVKKQSTLPLDRFLASPDVQDIVLFNLHLAIQNCIDMAAHIVSEQGLGVAGSSRFFGWHGLRRIGSDTAVPHTRCSYRPLPGCRRFSACSDPPA